MFRFLFFYFNLSFLVCFWSTTNAGNLEKKWIDISHAVPRSIERQIEQQHGLESACIGWNKQDGLMVPSFNFICRRPVGLCESRALYTKVISKLSSTVISFSDKKTGNKKKHKRVPVDLTLSFISLKSNSHFHQPYIAYISNGKGMVRYHSFDSKTKLFREIYREPEWNLVTWSDSYQPEVVRENTAEKETEQYEDKRASR